MEYFCYHQLKTLHLASGVKISSPKQILQRLPIALAQGKAGHTSKTY